MGDSREAAFAVAGVLAEHKGGEVTILDLAAHSGWTDWFVIASTGSVTHMRGLARHVEDYAASTGLDVRGGRTIHEDEEWVLLDLGDVVVHLMSERARAFYELERLWFQASATRVEAPQVRSGGDPGRG